MAARCQPGHDLRGRLPDRRLTLRVSGNANLSLIRTSIAPFDPALKVGWSLPNVLATRPANATSPITQTPAPEQARRASLRDLGNHRIARTGQRCDGQYLLPDRVDEQLRVNMHAVRHARCLRLPAATGDARPRCHRARQPESRRRRELSRVHLPAGCCAPPEGLPAQPDGCFVPQRRRDDMLERLGSDPHRADRSAWQSLNIWQASRGTTATCHRPLFRAR
jgi:hypothetical protein